MEPEEFSMLVREGKSAAHAIGNTEWGMQHSEMESRRLRRSLYIVQDVKEGDVVTSKNIRAIRPGGGCAPKFFEELIGRKFKSSFKSGTPLSIELVVD
jgi:N-acetylneuraminate synthase